MLCHKAILMSKLTELLCHKAKVMSETSQKLCHKLDNLFNSSITDGELMKMKNNERERTTIYINPEVWQLARLKANCSGSSLIEELLINYIGNDSNIIGYEQKIKESKEIIRREKSNIKQYEKAIELLEEEMIENGKNIKLLGECAERIKQYHSSNKFVSVQFLLRLSKIKNVLWTN